MLWKYCNRIFGNKCKIIWISLMGCIIYSGKLLRTDPLALPFSDHCMQAIMHLASQTHSFMAPLIAENVKSFEASSFGKKSDAFVNLLIIGWIPEFQRWIIFDFYNLIKCFFEGFAPAKSSQFSRGVLLDARKNGSWTRTNRNVVLFLNMHTNLPYHFCSIWLIIAQIWAFVMLTSTQSWCKNA